LEVDNSDGSSPKGAVYKGATTALVNGQVFLYVTNFRSRRVEVYDTTFKRVNISEELFDDDAIPRDFAPFNIQNIGGTLFVTYAMQDGAKHDDVAGDGLGFVELYEPPGRHIGHLQHGQWLNAPWGVVWTPRDFGLFSNSILVGNAQHDAVGRQSVTVLARQPRGRCAHQTLDRWKDGAKSFDDVGAVK
jgi:uncharacterized protein (TIGR03118 family)